MTDVVNSWMAEKAQAEAEAKEDTTSAARRQEVRAAALEFGRTWAGITTQPGEELPPGTQRDPENCVFANLLGGVWNGTDWRPTAEHVHPFQLPDEVREFIHRFDNGEYPDLIGVVDA